MKIAFSWSHLEFKTFALLCQITQLGNKVGICACLYRGSGKEKGGGKTGKQSIQSQLTMSSENDIFELSYILRLCPRHFCLNVCSKLMMIFSVALVRQLLSKEEFSQEINAVFPFFFFLSLDIYKQPSVQAVYLKTIFIFFYIS